MSQVKSSPRVTVLMTVFNERPDWVRRAVDSVLGQTFDDFELIIIDDGSTAKDTLEELDCVEARGDVRVRLIHQENTGLTRALNRGIEMAQGEFLCRHDSDDWSSLTRLEKQVSFLDEHPDVTLVGSGAQLYDEQSRPFAQLKFPTDTETIRRLFPVTNPICHGAICARLAAVRELGGYREELSVFAEDYDLFWRMSDAASVANLPDILYHRLHRLSSKTTTQAYDRTIAVDVIRALGNSRRNGQEISFEDALNQAHKAKRSDAQLETATADEMLRAAAFGHALRRYISAIRYDPLYWRAWLKIGRLLIYAACPPLRWRLFHEPYREVAPPQRT